MLRQFLTLVLAVTALGPINAFAYDVCDSRPDLCDDAPPEKAAAIKQGKCRLPNKTYTDLEMALLPKCQAAKAMRKKRAVSVRTAPATRALASSRGPASVNTSPVAPNISYDSYMSDNANHPELREIIKDHQRAFVDTAKPAVITFSPDMIAPDPAAPPFAGGAAAGVPAQSAPAVPGAAVYPAGGPVR